MDDMPTRIAETTTVTDTMKVADKAKPTPRDRLDVAIKALPSERTVRLWSGVVLFVFALTHFLNHALGIFGVEAMQVVQDVRRGFWRSDAGTALLAGAAFLHIAMALKGLARRRTWRMPWHEALQIGLGLMIPIWLTAHVVGTRGVYEAAGVDDNYDFMLRAMWPGLAWQQSMLLLIVWVHSCIGLNHTLRTRPWFPKWQDALLIGAALIPVLALAGFVAGGREALTSTKPWVITDAHYLAYVDELYWTNTILMKLAGLTLAVILGRYLLRLRRGRLAIRYVDGPNIKASPGASLLEISRANGVPHASVCGGRARCSTCRVLVIEGGEALPEPEDVESKVLRRIKAPPGVRLACQIRPNGPLTVERLIAVESAAAHSALAEDPYRWGVERRVTVMFADIRGFTALAEKSFPYDVVFLLNRFLTEMTRAIEANGGMVDKYLGDGLMAIFGIKPQAGSGATAALHAANDMLVALGSVNEEFRNSLVEPLRIGIGIHGGRAILGRIGGNTTAATLTALGDTVNTASRLEALTKEFRCACVVSAETLRAAKLVVPDATMHKVPVRGRVEPVEVYAIQSFAGLAEARAEAAA